jgi:hypothetical protein
MLENYLLPHLQQDKDRDFVFQQDGAPSHFHLEVTSYYNRTVVAWIGRGGTRAWPSRSPDLTPQDFYVCGKLKTKVLFQSFLQVWKNYRHG